MPAALAWLVFSPRWRRAWLIMLLTMAVDADHLLATPIYDPQRCSIGFHPLHTWGAISIYSGLLLFSKTRVVAIGLVVHMALDTIDCLWMALE